MPTKFEDAMTALKAENFQDPQTIQLIELMVAQNERIKNLEHFVLEAKHRLGTVEKIQDEHSQSIGSLATSRDTTETRVKTVEGKPEVDDKRIDELDKRVTVVEGAVGSKAYKRAEVKTNGADLAPPKPGFFETVKPATAVPA